MPYAPFFSEVGRVQTPSAFPGIAQGIGQIGASLGQTFLGFDQLQQEKIRRQREKEEVERQKQMWQYYTGTTLPQQKQQFEQRQQQFEQEKKSKEAEESRRTEEFSASAPEREFKKTQYNRLLQQMSAMSPQDQGYVDQAVREIEVYGNQLKTLEKAYKDASPEEQPNILQEMRKNYAEIERRNQFVGSKLPGYREAVSAFQAQTAGTRTTSEPARKLLTETVSKIAPSARTAISPQTQALIPLIGQPGYEGVRRQVLTTLVQQFSSSGVPSETLANLLTILQPLPDEEIKQVLTQLLVPEGTPTGGVAGSGTPVQQGGLSGAIEKANKAIRGFMGGGITYQGSPIPYKLGFQRGQ